MRWLILLGLIGPGLWPAPRSAPQTDEDDRSAMLEAVLGAPLESKPGEKFSYSKVGYDVLGAIVEIASGVSLEDYFRENLFAPGCAR